MKLTTLLMLLLAGAAAAMRDPSSQRPPMPSSKPAPAPKTLSAGLTKREGSYSFDYKNDGSMRLTATGRKHPQFYTIKMRGLYEVNSTGGIVCSFVGNSSDLMDKITMDSVTSTTVSLVSPAVTDSSCRQRVTMTPSFSLDL